MPHRHQASVQVAALFLFAFAGLANAQVSVTAGGQPTLSIPIEVPPGVGVQTPQLALSFGGSQAPGPLGVGWRLSGLSLISRCPNIKGLDGAFGGVTLTTSDRLCLDGERLLRTDVNGVPSAGGWDARGMMFISNEFRTEHDSGMRVRPNGTLNQADGNGPATIVAYTKDGRTLTFGSPIVASSATAGTAWPLASANDGASFPANNISYLYSQRDVAWGSGNTSPTAGHEWNLTEIDYGYTGSASNKPNNKIVFEYEDRAANAGGAQDRIEAYANGVKNVGIQRLKTIRTYTSAVSTAVPVTTYKLAYEIGGVTGFSRLRSITECSGADETKCMPPTVLTYQDGGNEAYVVNPAFASSPLASAALIRSDKTSGVLVGDFNGDGKSDIIRWSDTPSANQLWLSDGTGNFVLSGNSGLTNDNLFTHDGCYSSVVADVNGDGLPDIVRYSGATTPAGAPCAAYGTTAVFINNGNGTFTKQPVTGPDLTLASGVNWKNFLLFDANGDGKVDILTAVAPPTAAGKSCNSVGVTCARVWLGNGDGTFTEVVGSSANHQAFAIPPIGGTPAGSGYTTDINGDGLLDVISTSSAGFGGFQAWLSKGDGNFALASSTPCPVAIDANGDGRADCLDPVAATLTVGGATTSTFNLSSGVLSGAALGLSVIDANGDGRYDLLRWVNSPSTATPNLLELSNGDGSFRASSAFGLATTPMKSTDGSADFVVGDFTGHGATEFLVMTTAGANTLYVKADSSPPDLLRGVKTPLGLVTTLAWEPLSNTARYTSGRTSPAVAPPKVDITPPVYVITSMTTGTAVGTGTSVRQYAYTGLRASSEGRGLLGFMETREQHKAADGSDATDVTSYLQDVPFVGLVSSRRSYTGTLSQLGTLLTRVTNSYCDGTTAGTAINTASPQPPAPCAVVATALKRPYLYQSFLEAWEPSGAAAPTKLTTNTVDAYGDTTNTVETTTGAAVDGGTQTFTQTTTSEYCAPQIDGGAAPTCPSGATNPNRTDSNNWTLGHPTRVVVTRTTPDNLPRTVAGNGPHATANAGTGTPPPSNPLPAQLMAIILELLSD